MTRKLARNRDDDEVSVDRAMDIIRQSYYNEVREWAEDYDKRIAKGEWSDREEFIEALEQDVDSAARVIYTFQARVGLLCSRNEDAYFEEFGDSEGVCTKDGIEYSKLMYFAFCADIFEHMESDIDDDDTFAEDEEEDEED